MLAICESHLLLNNLLLKCTLTELIEPCTRIYSIIFFQFLVLFEQGPVLWHVIGTSMGGSVAAMFAVRNQQRVEKLTLICPAGK